METQTVHLKNGSFALYLKPASVSRQEVDALFQAIQDAYKALGENQSLFVLIDASNSSIILTDYLKQKVQNSLTNLPTIRGAIAIVLHESLAIANFRLFANQLSRSSPFPYPYQMFTTVDEATEWLNEKSENLSISSTSTQKQVRTKPQALIVEDDPRSNNLLAKILLSEKYNYETVHRGDHALDVLVNYQPDIILLDIFLPGANGYQILEFIRSATYLQQMTVITVSASVAVFETLELGAHYALHKPISPRELRKILQEVKGDEFSLS